MGNTIDAIGRSLGTDVQVLDTISHNVANINTPGYRGVRAVPDFEAAAGLRTGLDLRDGSISQTDRKLDLALHGPGFFAIQRDGQTFLTRSGVFHLDADGQLLTATGDAVLGTSGPISLSSGNVRIDAQGGIWDGQQNVAQLQIVSVSDPTQLRAAGDGVYAYDGAQSTWTGSVAQGAIEHANVDAADQTILLMETTRHAESLQRAISIYDKAMDVGINHIGEN
jgi:flagellar basal-body rod protein FlgG